MQSIKKLAIATSIILFFCAPSWSGPSCLDSPACRNDVRLKLLDMYESDQGVRLALHQGQAQSEEVQAVDAKNQKALKEIIDLIGWPTRARVGQIGAEAATLVATHATNDPALQDLALTHMAHHVDERGFDKQAYFTRYDKILVERDGHQRYGTQGWCDPETDTWQVHPNADEFRDTLDEERAKASLPSLDQYVQLVTASFCQAG